MHALAFLTLCLLRWYRPYDGRARADTHVRELVLALYQQATSPVAFSMHSVLFVVLGFGVSLILCVLHLQDDEPVPAPVAAAAAAPLPSPVKSNVTAPPASTRSSGGIALHPLSASSFKNPTPAPAHAPAPAPAPAAASLIDETVRVCDDCALQYP